MGTIIYFRNELAYINCRHREIEERELNGKPFCEQFVESLYRREDEVNAEMKRCGYTTLEIDKLQQNAEFFGSVKFKLLNVEEYKKEQKRLGCSDEEIEKEVKQMRSLIFMSSMPFLIDSPLDNYYSLSMDYILDNYLFNR